MRITTIAQLIALTTVTAEQPRAKIKKFSFAKYRSNRTVDSLVFIGEHPQHPGNAIFCWTGNYATFYVIKESELSHENVYLSDDHEEACIKAIEFAQRDLESIKEIYGEYYTITENLDDHPGYVPGEKLRKTGYDTENELIELVDINGTAFSASEDEVTKIKKY